QFHLFGGEERTIDMMHRQDKIPYASLGDIAAISLQFDIKGVEMMIILPRERTPEALKQTAIKYLSTHGLKSINDKLSKHRKVLALPKFKAQYKSSLKDVLKDVGLNRSFSDDAEFPRIAKQHLKISDVIHEAVLKVDEHGAEASAATSVVMNRMMGSINKPEQEIYFTVDRPFLVAIYDKQTNLPIFTGAISEVGAYEKAGEEL
ncbi:MAG: putative serpin family protein, partial [Streblomastix strix]